METLRICPECSYDLRAVEHQRCPECGLDLDFIDADVSCIPWCDPKHGAIGGYLKTAGMALFQPKRLLREVYRPVDYAAAQRFRWICVAIGYASILAGAGVLLLIEPNLWLNWTSVAGPWFVAWCALCILLLLALASGVHTYWFHPKRLPVEHQNRTLALSYYASAVLCALPVGVVAGVLIGIVAGWVLEQQDADEVLFLVAAGQLLMLVFVALFAIRCVARFARILLGRARDAHLIRGLTLLAYAMLSVGCLVVLPVIGWYIGLIRASFEP